MTTDDQARCLVLDLPPTYDTFLATLGKSLRYDVRRLDKSPFKEGKATIENPPDGLDILFEPRLERIQRDDADLHDLGHDAAPDADMPGRAGDVEAAGERLQLGQLEIGRERRALLGGGEQVDIDPAGRQTGDE